MRVLMLAQFYPPTIGGEERMAESLAVGLARRGHDVAVATLRQPSQGRYDEREGVRLHRLPGLAQRFGALFSDSGRRHAPPAPDPETVLALRSVLDLEQPDVVHGHNWLAIAYLPLQRRQRAAYVLSLHDFSLVCANKRLVRNGHACDGPGVRKCLGCASRQYGAALGPLVALGTAAASRAQRRAVDLFLPVSTAVADVCALAPGTYEVMPNFLLEATAPPTDADPRLERLPEGDFLLFVGDVWADKGADVLLEAHARMAARVPLVLIGRKEQPDLLRDRGEDVIALGPLDHAAVLAAWSRCTIGVVPSVQPEAFGVVALEAMAAGAPVVASRHGGLPDVVVEGETGLLVAPGHVGELAAALDRLMADPELRHELGAAGARRAREFSADAILPRFEAAYARAMSTRAARGLSTSLTHAAAPGD